MGLRKRKLRAVQRGSQIKHLPARCDIQISDHGDRVLSFRGDLRKGLKEFASMCLEVYGVELPEMGLGRNIKEEEKNYLEEKKRCEKQPAKEE